MERDRKLVVEIIKTVNNTSSYGVASKNTYDAVAKIIADLREKIEKQEYIAGVLYAVQQLVLFADHPTMAADYIVCETGISKDEFIAAQKTSGHENTKMIKFLKEALADER